MKYKYNEYKKVNSSFWHSLNYCVQKQKKSQHQDLGRAHAQNDISQIWLWCHTVSCHNNNGGKKCVQRDGKLYPDQSYMYQVLFNRRGKWLEKFPMDRGNNAEWICIWWWLNLVIVFTTKLLLRSLLRISPLDDLEDLEDLSSWGSWKTFLLRIFPLDDLDNISSWGSWETFLLKIFPLENLSSWGS